MKISSGIIRDFQELLKCLRVWPNFFFMEKRMKSRGTTSFWVGRSWLWSTCLSQCWSALLFWWCATFFIIKKSFVKLKFTILIKSFRFLWLSETLVSHSRKCTRECYVYQTKEQSPSPALFDHFLVKYLSLLGTKIITIKIEKRKEIWETPWFC